MSLLEDYNKLLEDNEKLIGALEEIQDEIHFLKMSIQAHDDMKELVMRCLDIRIKARAILAEVQHKERE